MPCYEYKGKKYRALDLIKEIKSDEQAFIKSNNLQTGKWRYEVPDGELKITSSKNTDLEDIIDAPELFKAYPELKNIGVMLGIHSSFDNSGEYTPFVDQSANDMMDILPEIKVRATDTNNAKSVLIHEIQHAIQDIEGFAKGGTPEKINESDLLREIRNSEQIIEDTRNSARDWVKLNNERIALNEKFVDLFGSEENKSILDEIENKIEVIESKLKQVESEIGVKDQIRRLNKLKEKLKDTSGNEQYKRLSGEVESRNVQTRMNFTPEQRRNTLLQETEDVAREDQIILMDGMGVSNLELNISDTATTDLSNRPNVVKALTKISDELGEPVHIVHSSEAPEIDSGTKLRIKRNKDIKALYHNGETYIFSDRIDSVSAAIKSYLHETVVHKGLRQTFAQADKTSIIGKQFVKLDDLLSDVYDSMPRNQKIEIAKIYAPTLYENGQIKHTPTQEEKSVIAEEYLAKIAEDQSIYNEPTLTKWKQFINRLAQIIRKAFRLTSNQFSQTDLFDIVRESRARLKKKAEGKTDEETRFRVTEENLSLGDKPNDMTNPEYWKDKTVTYLHSPEPSPYMGSKFGQDVEPAGKYITIGHQLVPHGYTEGQVTFKNPLVIDVTGQNYPQWKVELSKKYNATGKKLTNKLLKEGYDSIITVEEYKGKYDTSETIILNSEIDSEKGKREKALPANTILINGVSRSTLNSNGKPIANSEEGIRNFYKWFGDSKVVDSEGRPLVVYHGTPPNNVISEFYQYSFFAEDRYNALAYARSNRNSATSRKNGILMEVYLKLENPYNLFDKTKTFMSLEDMNEMFKNEKINLQARIDILNEIHKISEERFGLNHYYKFDNPDRIIELFNEYKGGLSDSIIKNPPTQKDVDNEENEFYKRQIIIKKRTYDNNIEFIKKINKEGIDIRHFILGDNRSSFNDYYTKEIPSYLIVSSETFRNYLKSNNYDSVILTDSTYSKTTKRKEKSYLNFSPSQIKSINNNGSFDPQSPDIRFQIVQDELNSITSLPKSKASDLLKSVNETVEAAMDDAHGIKATSLWERIKAKLVEIKESGQHFKHITEAEFPVVYDKLRQFEAIPDRVKKEAYERMGEIIRPISKNKEYYKAFERYIVLQDLVNDIENTNLFDGKDVPWGYNENKTREQAIEDLKTDMRNVRTYVMRTPVVLKAIRDRQAMMKEVKKALVENKLLKDNGNDKYFHHQVLAYMGGQVFPGVSSKDVRNNKKGWQESRVGSMQAYNTKYIESEFEVLAQSLEQVAIKNILGEIGGKINIMASLIKQAENEGGKWRDYIPEGYKFWFPQKGTHAYKSASKAERDVQNILNQEGTEDVKEVIAEAEGSMWVIPEKVAKQLDSMKDPEKEMVYPAVLRGITGKWKQWTLLSPFRMMKYNFNNMSGDLDIVLAADPSILKRKYAHTAMVEAWNEMRGKGMSTDMKEALQYGIITSGLSIQEIPDINQESLFRSISKGSGNWAKKAWSNTGGVYWDGVTAFTQFRENVLRVAAYKFYKEQIEAGKTLFGASDHKAVQALYDEGTNSKEVAAKLARELLGDYGNLSQGGQWLRAHSYPFWSWVELNTPRYYRLLKNTKFEYNSGIIGKVAGVGAKKVVVNVGMLGMRAMLLMGLMVLYNRIFWPDEDDELHREKNYKLRLILGRNDDGTIKTMKIQGAFSDVLAFFGLEDAVNDVDKIAKGKKTAGDMVFEGSNAFVNKFAQGAMPFTKTGYEVFTGRTLYPDMFSSRPIRDKGEHIARMASMDKVYNYLTHKPVRSFGKELSNLLTYDSDPGESAYYTMRENIFDFMDDNGVEPMSGNPTDRSNALLPIAPYWN